MICNGVFDAFDFDVVYNEALQLGFNSEKSDRVCNKEVRSCDSNRLT